MRRVYFLIKKEFKQGLRDPPMLAIIFLVPLIQLFILSWAVTVEVKHLKLGVIDLDRSRESRELLERFAHTEQFDFVWQGENLAAIRPLMKAWKLQAVLVIPRDFGRDLYRGLRPSLQLVLDGVDGNSAGIAMGFARKILLDYGIEFLGRPLQRIRLKPLHLADMEERMWYNPDLSNLQYMVPGIVVILLTILSLMLTGISLVKEKEIGTLEQLIVTPLKRHQLIAGKIIPFLMLAYLELGIVLTVAVSYFNIRMAGSYLLLGGLSLVYLFATLGLGIFISTVTSSQQQAMFVGWFIVVFMILFRGFFIPIPNMPPILQKLTYLNPMRYAVSIVRDIFQKGSALPYLWKDVVPLTAFSVLIFSFSVLTFHKRID